MLGMIFDVLPFISVYVLLILFSTGSAETDFWWGGLMNDHLMASCARNIHTKNY